MGYWIPDWLYKLLPYIYIVVGLLTIFSLEGKVAMVSGILLSNIGFLLIGLRRYHFSEPVYYFTEKDLEQYGIQRKRRSGRSRADSRQAAMSEYAEPPTILQGTD